MKEAIPFLSGTGTIELVIDVVIAIAVILFIRSRVKAHRRSKAILKKIARSNTVTVKDLYSGYILFVDTETTGLPKNPKLPAEADDNWPRLVQICWIMADHDGNIINQESHLVRPDGFTIPEDAAKIHGISTEKAMAEGRSLYDVLKAFYKDCKRARLLVGHNINFDKRVIGSEFMRLGHNDPLQFIISADTMKLSVGYCHIRRWNGTFKYPTLQQLYRKAFHKNLSGAHDASHDVTATMECFYKLVQKNHIRLIDK